MTRTSATNKRWVIAVPNPALTTELAHSLKLAPALAQVLINRGYTSLEAAKDFLNPQLRQLGDPFELPDMAAAVDAVLDAIEKKRRIVIYGDYDVDGVTSSALLVRVLKAAGASAANFLPHRMDEGYGLSQEGVARCLEEHKPQLLIAVDCGTGSTVEIAELKRRGVDTIVLDHHEPTVRLPECVALVNPKCEENSPLAILASVGVAFKLAHALLKRERRLAEKIDLREHLDLVAVGTVADIVPLTGENRILVKAGLERLSRTDKVGLRALMDIADVPERLSPYHIGFRIGPRLNAAGRLDDATAALELLLTRDAARAAKLAGLLDDHNAARQRIEERIVEEALAMAREFEGDHVLVLAKEGWHVGVIGIVASRVSQEFHRPTVIIGIEDGMGKGSCRSITGFSVVEALEKTASLLERFGGHDMAAGLSIGEKNIPRLRQALNEHACAVIEADDLIPRVFVDAVVRLGDLKSSFLDALKRIEPCGSDNPPPVFAVQGVRLERLPKVVGKKHLKFYVTDGNETAEAIWWGMGETQLPQGRLDVAFVPELNEYRGVETIQLKVRDVRGSREA